MKENTLIGQKFGRLTVVDKTEKKKNGSYIYRCQCDCGNITEVPGAYLKNGHTKSCGCIKREKRESLDITGQRFGRLVAVKFIKYDHKHRDVWLFKCDCGNEKEMPASYVKWGRVRSCGCLATEKTRDINLKDITGERFNRLVALEPTKERDASGSIIWKCQCDCGNIAYYSVNTLHGGRVKSCGCLYNESRVHCIDNRTDFIDGTSVAALISAKNLKSNNKSGHTGVYLNKRNSKWEAYIHFKKKKYYLGSYTEKTDAIKARKRAEEKLHDPFIEENLAVISDKRREK